MDNEGSNSAVNDSAVENTATTDSASVENNDSQVEDTSTQDDDTTSEETENQSNDESGDNQSDDNSDDQVDETKTDEKAPSKGEKRKDQLNTEIRDLVSQRNTIRQEVEKLNAEVYRPATTQELTDQINPDTGENYNRLEAQLESMRQEREVERYNNQVSENLVTIESEAQRALSDFPMFDARPDANGKPTNPDYNPEVAFEVAQILDSVLIRDPNVPEVDPRTGQRTGKGAIIGTSISPYKLYQSHAKAAQAQSRKAEIQGQRNVEKMLSNADQSTGGQGKTTAKPFEELTAKQMRENLRAKGHDF